MSRRHRPRIRECGQAPHHTTEIERPTKTAKKKRCVCGKAHVWVEPKPERKRCKECGQPPS